MNDDVHNAQKASIVNRWQWDDVPTYTPAGPAAAPPGTIEDLEAQAKALLARYRWSEAVPGLENTPATRLSRLRIQRGYGCAVDAARAMGINPTTYQHHENGTRGISNLAADRYAVFFDASAGLILYGEPPAPAAARVPVVGCIGEQGRIVPGAACAETPPDLVEAPAGGGDGRQAFVVAGDSLAPAYRKGDIVFSAMPDAPGAGVHDGLECIVETAGHEHLLCMCEAGPRGWTLRPHAGKPLRGVQLVAAAPVLWVQRNGYAICARRQAAAGPAPSVSPKTQV